MSEDPIKDGLNWYAYCGNHPLKYKAALDLAPSDRFSSPEEAADFGLYIGRKSIDEEKYASCIYKGIDGEYYDTPRNDYETYEQRRVGFIKHC